MSTPITFDNSYSRLAEHLYTRLEPTPVANPSPVRVNRELAGLLNIDLEWLESETATRTFAGNSIPVGADPLAMVYAGHQFGGWNPQLGDGRAILIGETLGRDGERYDVQLKGAGPTPYSRGGDGRSPLGPVLREYIVSEAMTALGVPSTRSLAAVSTGEQVYRDRPLPGAVLTRVARGHTRIGTFQFFASRQDNNALRQLVDYVIVRHYPDLISADNPGEELLKGLIEKQAKLVAQWQWLGFIHGVMNTDNMTISGETIDYGPCAFMDRFDPATVYSSIDHGGRYAYQNQPGIAHWNLACFAQCLLPLLSEDQETAVACAQAAVDRYPEQFQQAYLSLGRAKLGLTHEHEDDPQLIQDLLMLMHQQKSDFTLTFRKLADMVEENTTAPGKLGDLFQFSTEYEPWLARWRERLMLENADLNTTQHDMYRQNPALIPRNHLVQEAIELAENNGDFDAFHALVDTLENPFEYHPDREKFALPPRPEQEVKQTFCGT